MTLFILLSCCFLLVFVLKFCGMVAAHTCLIILKLTEKNIHQDFNYSGWGQKEFWGSGKHLEVKGVRLLGLQVNFLTVKVGSSNELKLYKSPKYAGTQSLTLTLLTSTGRLTTLQRRWVFRIKTILVFLWYIDILSLRVDR